MTKPFAIRESLKEGWELTKKHSALVYQVLITIFALSIAQSIVDRVLADTFEGFFATVILTIVSVVVGVGATRITLLLAQGKEARYADIMPPLSLVWVYFVASVLAGLIIIGGLILLIVPGIYFMVRYSMVKYAVIDGAQIKESLSKSSAYTDGVKWHLLGFFIVLILFNILGVLALLVGLLVTIPVSSFAIARVYMKLKERAEHATVTPASA